jgi:hypothetical protein
MGLKEVRGDYKKYVIPWLDQGIQVSFKATP